MALAHAPHDRQRLRDRGGELVGVGDTARVVELRKQQHVKPLRVGRSLDSLRQLRSDELQQSVAHPAEVAQEPVVGERDMGSAVEKRVHVLL